MARSNSEGAKRAKNSGLKRWRKVDGGRMRGGGKGDLTRRDQVGGMEGDRSTGPSDRRTERQTGLETAHYGRRMRVECGGSGLLDTINIGSADRIGERAMLCERREGEEGGRISAVGSKGVNRSTKRGPRQQCPTT